jgi:hypothetical protein
MASIMISSLPNEILTDIFQYVVQGAYRWEVDKNPPALHAIIRVCKRWHALGVPILYSDVRLNNIDVAILFVEALYNYNPSYAALTVNFDLSQVNLPKIIATRLSKCSFTKLISMVMNTGFSRYLSQTDMVPKQQLQEVDFGGRASQEVVDKHSETLRTLKLVIDIRQHFTPSTRPKAFLSLSLPRLCKLDLTYREGNMQALSN